MQQRFGNWRNRGNSDEWLGIDKGDKDGILQQSQDGDREEEARMLLQAVQEPCFLWGLCTDENLQVQSKGMLWP